jgi:hypothetical protein
MKTKLILAAVVAGLASAAGTASAQQEPPELLTGDPKLACEAILCLSTSKRPHECEPSIRRYLDIRAKWWSDTVRDRRNFLQLCPAANQSPEMESLTSAIAEGVGQCDAQALNSALTVYEGNGEYIYSYIKNQMPGYCGAYINHPYTDLVPTQPRYIGTPENGGYWVDTQDYDAALAEYNQRQQSQLNWNYGY